MVIREELVSEVTYPSSENPVRSTAAGCPLKLKGVMLRERESERQTHTASEVGGGVERKGEEK